MAQPSKVVVPTEKLQVKNDVTLMNFFFFWEKNYVIVTSSQFIDQNHAKLCGIVQNHSCFVELHKEGRLLLKNVVRCSDASENPVNRRKGKLLSRYFASNLAQNG